MSHPASLAMAAMGIALSLLPLPGRTQDAAASGAAACPTPAEIGALHLYGAWQATWDGLDEPATLTLGRNLEHPDGVRGEIRRGAAQALVAGDVDDGDFTLEESTDGQTISATWTGRVVDTACGKEIRGTWTRAHDGAAHPFVLRKRPGWQ